MQELTRKYQRHDSAAVEFIDQLLAAAGMSLGSLMANAPLKELDHIERIDRLLTLLENRRNASLREIDRRRAVLAEGLRKSFQQVEQNQIELIESTPAEAKNTP